LNIHDIARRLNISIGTISRALNDRAGVSAKTRQRVLEAAKKYGYSPNQSGRSLRRGATGMIGFMVIPNRDRTTKGEAFFMTIFDGLQSVLAAHGLDLVIHYCGADQDPEAHVQRIVERRMVDGLIISQTNRSDPRIDYLIQKKLPFIAFGRSGTRRAHSWTDLDFEGVAEQSIDLLYRLGHRRIAIATAANELNFGYLYLEACQASLARRGIALTDDLIFREPLTEAGGYSLGGRLLALRDRPTAVALVQNTLTLGLYQRLSDAGVVPGRDLSIIGFDQSPNGDFLRPSLTQFRVSLTELGEWLGGQIMALIEARRAGRVIRHAHKIWPLQIEPGESAQPPAR